MGEESIGEVCSGIPEIGRRKRKENCIPGNVLRLKGRSFLASYN